MTLCSAVALVDQRGDGAQQRRHPVFNKINLSLPPPFPKRRVVLKFGPLPPPPLPNRLTFALTEKKSERCSTFLTAAVPCRPCKVKLFTLVLLLMLLQLLHYTPNPLQQQQKLLLLLQLHMF